MNFLAKIMEFYLFLCLIKSSLKVSPPKVNEINLVLLRISTFSQPFSSKSALIHLIMFSFVGSSFNTLSRCVLLVLIALAW